MPIRQWIADAAARLLRAALLRVANDMDLAGQLMAAASSAELATERMNGAAVFMDRMDLLDFAVTKAPEVGLVCEFGVYRGETLKRVAKAIPTRTVHGFDAFTGLPEDWRPGFAAGTFETDPSQLALPKNCELHPGLFSETLPAFLDRHREAISFLHIDCDLYTSTTCVLDLMSERIVDGTIILFDEFFNYPGWQNHEFRAFEEFLCRTNLCPIYLAYNRNGQQVAIRMSALPGDAATTSNLIEDEAVNCGLKLGQALR